MHITSYTFLLCFSTATFKESKGAFFILKLSLGDFGRQKLHITYITIEKAVCKISNL